MEMCDLKLTKYWIQSPKLCGPYGFGVTAFSLDDAIKIIKVIYGSDFLPEDLTLLKVVEGFSSPEEVEPRLGRIGPVSVRGIWYPYWTLGVPKWAQEKIDNQQLS